MGAFSSALRDPDDPTAKLPGLQPIVPPPAQGGAAPAPSLGPLPALSGGAPSGMSSLKPIVTSPRQDQEQALQQKIAQFDNPAKPQGFWQKLGHIVAQNPYTQSYRNTQENSRVAQLAGLENQDVTEQEAARRRAREGAQGAQLAEETREAPGKAQSAEAVQGAEAAGSTPDIATYRS